MDFGFCCPHRVAEVKSTRESPPSLFGSFSAADCTFLSPCLTAPADVAASSTYLATIAQRVQRQGCWGRKRSLSSAPQHKSAGSRRSGFLEHVRPRHGLGNAQGLRPSIRRWCLPSGGMGRPGQELQTTTVLFWRWHVAGRKPPTPSSQERMVAHVWWSLPPSLAGVGTVRPRNSSQLWPMHGLKKFHWCCKAAPRLLG